MQKFILTSRGVLRFGDVCYHKDLLEPGDHCIGGGYWEVEPSGMSLRLHGSSTDFGSPKWSMVRTESLKVPDRFRGLALLWEDAYEGSVNLPAEWKIEYV